MSQIAVRLANEGVPVQAIARATGVSSSDVREQLAEAMLAGQLLSLPLNDWPAASGARKPARLEDTKPAQEAAAQRVFRLSLPLVRVLFLLLREPEVSHDRIAKILNTTSKLMIWVTMSRLRRRLDAFGVTVHMIYGFGYCMTIAHQRKVKSLLRV